MSTESLLWWALLQGFIKSRGRRSVVYRVVKDQSRPHVSAYAISSAYQYMSFDEHCPVKDCHRTQQVHYDNAEQLYDTICRAEATVDKAAVERHTIRLQNTVGKFYSTSLTRELFQFSQNSRCSVSDRFVNYVGICTSM